MLLLYVYSVWQTEIDTDLCVREPPYRYWHYRYHTGTGITGTIQVLALQVPYRYWHYRYLHVTGAL